MLLVPIPIVPANKGQLVQISQQFANMSSGSFLARRNKKQDLDTVVQSVGTPLFTTTFLALENAIKMNDFKLHVYTPQTQLKPY
ncbi:unnamed protein product [Phytophthora lilii]|uniref:Unnamed protein product n=1 Tax=Phytophthora lilii TaxID=2077276 RepID=A0A9W6WY54_9STRA|nr:unnamed protein product [Phytophthora lilii]